MASRTLHIEITGDPARMLRRMRRVELPWPARAVDWIRERLGR
jgi:hypothetical protein